MDPVRNQDITRGRCLHRGMKILLRGDITFERNF